MRLLKLLNNASITMKSLISTLLSALVLIGMGGLATFSLLDVQRTMDAAGAAVTLRAQARSVAGDLARGQAALYRAINSKAQNVEAALVRAAKNDSMQAIDKARNTMASLQLAGLAIDVGLATAAEKSVQAYGEAAKQAAEFVEEDAFDATMFMTDAEQKYAGEEQAVAALLAAGTKLASAKEDDIKSVLHNGLVVIPIGAGLAVLFSIAFSTLFSRLISRPIVAMTGAMRRLADGDLAAEIPAVDRKDEVGQMAQAMLVFRQNAQEAHALQAAAQTAHALKERREAAMDRHTQDFGASAAGVMAASGVRLRRCGSRPPKCRQRRRRRGTALRARPMVRRSRRAILPRWRRRPNRCRQASARSANRRRAPLVPSVALWSAPA